MILELFTTFFKIGLFTFGGGYGMISLVKEECVEKKKWILEEEFVDLIVVAEATPGPIAINMATYIGYKKSNLFGAIMATIGVILPSIIIIFVIASFIENLILIKFVGYAFFGIRIAVAIMIIRTAYNLIRNEYKASVSKAMTLVLFFIYVILLFSAEIFSIKIPSYLFIIFSIILGIILDIFVNIKKEKI